MKSNAVQLLKTQTEFNNSVITKNIEGISHQDSMIFPNGEANCFNWIFGHLIFIRNAFIQILGRNPVWNKDEFKYYDRGAKSLEHIDELQDLEFLKTYFEKSVTELNNLLENMDDFKPENIEDLAALMLHEIYHSGQLGYMRRILGKEGKIK